MRLHPLLREKSKGGNDKVLARHFRGFRNIDLVADVGGDAHGTAVLLLHGGGQTRHSWGNAAHALISRGYYVVSLDMRGHGESQWPKDADYSQESLAQDVLAVSAALPSTPVLVGASMGGLASLVAVGESLDPARVARGLVLVDVTPRLNRAGAARITSFMAEAADGFESIDDAADAVTRYLPHRPRPADTSELQRNLRLRDGRFHWHWDPAFLTAPRNFTAMEARYEKAARTVKIPTLLVRGAESEIVTTDGANHLLELIPHAEYRSIPGAGHMVGGDRNDVFNDAVSEFLDKFSKPD